MAGLGFGLACSGALRWGKRHRRTRAVLVPVGLNLGALALLGAVLATGGEPGGLPARWETWVVPLGASLAVGVLGFRFPRAAGIPLVVFAAALIWVVVGALQPFSPLEPGEALPSVQPLTDRDLGSVFSWRADFIEPPRGIPGLPQTLVRFRPGSAVPGEWWWSWAASQGWARSSGTSAPAKPMKFGIYRMTLAGGFPTWTLEIPELAPPGE